MICTKCGKKAEYESGFCKYCKEPVVLEGCSPMGDISGQVFATSDTSVFANYEQQFDYSQSVAKKGLNLHPGVIAGAAGGIVIAVFLICGFVFGLFGKDTVRIPDMITDGIQKISVTGDDEGCFAPNKKATLEKIRGYIKKNIPKEGEESDLTYSFFEATVNAGNKKIIPLTKKNKPVDDSDKSIKTCSIGRVSEKLVKFKIKCKENVDLYIRVK